MEEIKAEPPTLAPPSRSFKKTARTRLIILHLLKKIALIGVVIFVGVFLTIILINRSVKGNPNYKPQLDTNIRKGIERTIQLYEMENQQIYLLPREERMAITDAMRQNLIEESGLNEPYLIKNLIWTFNALSFKWGGLSFTNIAPNPLFSKYGTRFYLNDILLQYLPLTMMLVSTSYLALILIGLPLALFLSQNKDRWYDRLITIIAPISSVPSWVLGILLITIFAIELRWLPFGGTLDIMPPTTKWGYIPIILKHMVLPCLAIFLSLIFQLIYSWRTIFITFGNEDYVELGKAVGLKPRQWQKKYLLRPSLPYIITSFSLLLISFWQLTMALETVFSWKGIGWLYINVGLPHFWGLSMYPGELIIALQLVVLFAYILGIVILMLDLAYVLVDPRIRLVQQESTFSPVVNHRKNRRLQLKNRNNSAQPEYRITLVNKQNSLILSPPLKKNRLSLFGSLKSYVTSINKIVSTIWKYPSAVIGQFIIFLLIAGSLYAVIALPYEEIGTDWGRSILTGKPVIPRIAKPAWINFFRQDDYLSTLIMNSSNGDAIKEAYLDEQGNHHIDLIFEFNYDYADFPSEMSLYFTSKFQTKNPFVNLTWITPEGREFPLSGTALIKSDDYILDEHINARRIVSANDKLKNWFNFSRVDTTPYFYLLFADPTSETPELVRGNYQLKVNGLAFEAESDIDAELIILGQVYGAAGTDNSRRDLLVPLFWGMPIALVIGLGGAISTTLLSMALAATGVWFGGWVDELIQKMTEVNLILPFMAIGVLAVAYLNVNIWAILIVMVLLNIFGSPLKSFRSALLQVKTAPYIEAAQTYGAKNIRIIFKYMVPKIIPVLIPQLVILIPSFVFLEATLGLFNITTGLPTWGTMIYQGLTAGALFGSRYWVLEPLFLLLITGFAFVLLGTALEKILNPRLMEK